jgi:hypothetical protein
MGYTFQRHTNSGDLRMNKLKPNPCKPRPYKPAVTSGDEFLPNTNLAKCPVCDGTGIVSRPPGVAGDVESWVGNATTYECKTCGGKGALWWKEDQKFTKEDMITFARHFRYTPSNNPDANVCLAEWIEEERNNK